MYMYYFRVKLSVFHFLHVQKTCRKYASDFLQWLFKFVGSKFSIFFFHIIISEIMVVKWSEPGP